MKAWGKSTLDELNELVKSDIYNSEPLLKIEKLSDVSFNGEVFPIYSFIIGNQNSTLPTLGLFGGVHGLERVGTQVIIHFLKNILSELKWNTVLRESLQHYRIVSIPLVNPVGMNFLKRSNGNGVDLMRNAPVESVKNKFYEIYRGHKIGPSLPWFRGDSDMELEAKILCSFVEKEIFKSSVGLAIDFHSGFGLKDRLWYPYAKTKDDFPLKKEAQKIQYLLDMTYAHHVYQIEAQSDSYTTHGDLWDYLFDKHFNEYKNENIFIPWTLEMGSWTWLKKNPIQILKRDGIFNPLKKHREERTMRRHFALINFFTMLIRNRSAWSKE